MVGRLEIALVGVELHFAVRQVAALAVHRDIGHVHDVGMQPLVHARARRLDLAENADEAALVIDADVLVAEQEDLVFAPGVRDLFRHRIVERLAQIDRRAPRLPAPATADESRWPWSPPGVIGEPTSIIASCRGEESRQPMPPHEEFDYLIIGAGSAGCVLANRLSALPVVRVLLLEAGGWDYDPMLRVPLGVGRIWSYARYDWGYATEPEPNVDGRRIEIAAAR